MAISMSMGDGPGKQKKKMRKFNTAQGKAIAAQKQARIEAYDKDPRARKYGAATEKMAHHDPSLPKNEYGMYKGESIPAQPYKEYERRKRAAVPKYRRDANRYTFSTDKSKKSHGTAAEETGRPPKSKKGKIMYRYQTPRI